MPYIASANSMRSGAMRNIFMGQAGVDYKSSIPAGARPPASWILAQKNGGMSSRNSGKITSEASGSAVMGLPATSSATITLDVPDATGGLIVSGSGTASLSISMTGLILSIASASGSASVSITPTALIGAKAGISGQSTLTVSAASEITAVGYMSGLSTSETEFSASSLAQAVWTAAAGSYNGAGTMGEKLNDAGSASNPWTESLEGALTAADIMRILLSVMAGKTTIDGTTVSFRDVADTKDRVIAEMTGSERTNITLDGGQ